MSIGSVPSTSLGLGFAEEKCADGGDEFEDSKTWERRRLLGQVKEQLKKKAGSLLHGFRHILDTEGFGKLSFSQLGPPLRKLGFDLSDVPEIWLALDSQGLDFVSLLNLSPLGFLHACHLRQVCRKRYGTVRKALDHVRRKDLNRLSRAEFLAGQAEVLDSPLAPPLLWRLLDSRPEAGGLRPDTSATKTYRNRARLPMSDLAWLDKWDQTMIDTLVRENQIDLENVDSFEHMAETTLASMQASDETGTVKRLTRAAEAERRETAEAAEAEARRWLTQRFARVEQRVGEALENSLESVIGMMKEAKFLHAAERERWVVEKDILKEDLDLVRRHLGLSSNEKQDAEIMRERLLFGRPSATDHAKPPSSPDRGGLYFER